MGRIYGSTVVLKKSKGRPQIRRQRYPIRPNDIVEFDSSIYRAVGVQNKGAYFKNDRRY